MRCSDCKSRKYCDNADKVNYCAGYIFDDSKPQEQTNEEWFCGLSTEEKADLMSRMVGCSNCPIPKDGRSCMGTYSGCWHEIIKWLKQPHTNE